MSIDRPLKDIKESDLLALISAGVREGKSIEFKREINISDDSAKRKFFAGVASFANTQGGDIVFGMEAKDGVAIAIQPLSDFNPDTETIRLRDLIRAHIEPKVYGLDFQSVSLKDGGHALVLRVPRTWVGAHMVTYGQDNRFYVRDNNGRRIMDVGEVRMAFSSPETLPERIRRLRLDRLSAIAGGDTPLPLSSSAAVVFHIIPVKAFDSFYECDLDSLISAEDKHHLYLQPPSVVYHNWLDIKDFSCKIVADAKNCQRGGPFRARAKSIGELGESPVHSTTGGASLPHSLDGCRR